MADYAKKKNDELAALCKERGLSHSGKKADLVKRLEDHDATGGATTTGTDASAITKAPVEDEIDWDDEPALETAKAATTKASSNAIAAGGVGVQVPNPQAVPNQVPAIDPAQTSDLKVADPPANPKPTADSEQANGNTVEPILDPAEAPQQAQAESEEKEEKDYSSGVADRTLDEEIEKRKARARKFGLPGDTDEIKALERAKRFGTTDVPGLLNRALPSGGPKKRRAEAPEGGASKRPQGGRPGMGGRRGSSRRDGGGREKRSGDAAGAPAPKLQLSEKDREAAERRRARFAAN